MGVFPSPRHIGRQLDVTRGRQVGEPGEPAEPAHAGVLGLGDEGRHVLLAPALDEANELRAPGVAAAVEAELGEGNPDLRRPAGGVLPNPGLPDRVGRVVHRPVRLQHAVPAYATRVDLEDEGGQAVEAGIELDGESVALAGGVPAGEQGADAGGLAVVELGTDVEGVPARSTRISVCSVGGAPSSGSRWVSWVTGVASAHGGSSRTPSSWMPLSRRAAAMVGAVADDPGDVSGACAASRADRPGARRATVIRTVKRRTGGGPPGDESEMPGMNLVVGIPYGIRRLGFHWAPVALS